MVRYVSKACRIKVQVNIRMEWGSDVISKYDFV